MVELRAVLRSDLSIFFEQQLDEDANHMAAFTSVDPANEDAWEKRWERLMADDKVIVKTILFDSEIAGHIARFERFEKPEVSYWIGRDYWGKGIATEALKQFLKVVIIRPLYARAAWDNYGSIRVLQKCGFVKLTYEKAHANARGKCIDEVLMILE